MLAACGTLPGEDQAQPEILEDESPGVKHPETSGFRVVERIEVDPPTQAPNFTLTDQNERLRSLENFRGNIVMMGFIYTHCPEACPILAANFKRLSDELSEITNISDLQQVFITTDPANDTPNRLRHYTQALGGDWLFLTGSLEEVQSVWDDYDVYWEIKDRSAEVVVFHSYKTYLIDRDGKFRYEFVGVWFPDEVIQDVQNLLEEQGDY